jgi:WD40 repeat protein
MLTLVFLIDQHCPGQERKQPTARATLSTKPEGVSCAVFSPDGKTLISVGGSIIHWDVATGKELSRSKGHNGAFSVSITRDGKTLATSAYDDGEVRLWEKDGNELARLRHTKDREGLRAVVFSADGKFLASGACDGTINLWDVAERKEKAKLDAHEGRVVSLLFTPDGSTLISVDQGDSKGKFWDVATGKEKRTFDGRMAVAITPDGNTLASRTEDGANKLWNVATGKETATMKGASAHWIALAFSPNGKLLASGRYGGGVVKLWDVATGEERATMKHATIIWALAFSPDNKTLASCSADGTIKLWDVGER